jgi:hypothetical protein
LLAGILVGPFTPGYVADQALASDLAEIEHLQKHGANFVVMGEREIALGMLDHAFGPPAASSTAANS